MDIETIFTIISFIASAATFYPFYPFPNKATAFMVSIVFMLMGNISTLRELQNINKHGVSETQMTDTQIKDSTEQILKALL